MCTSQGFFNTDDIILEPNIETLVVSGTFTVGPTIKPLILEITLNLEYNSQDAISQEIVALISTIYSNDNIIFTTHSTTKGNNTAFFNTSAIITVNPSNTQQTFNVKINCY